MDRKETFLKQLIDRAQALLERSPEVYRGLSEFGETIRVLRSLERLNREELAERAGLDPVFLSFLENGEVLLKELGPKVLDRLATALHMPHLILRAYLAASLPQAAREVFFEDVCRTEEA